MDEASQELQCHLLCSQGRANAPSTQAVLFESRYQGVPLQLRPRTPHRYQYCDKVSEARHSDTHNGQVFKRPCCLNIFQRFLQIPQFPIYSSLCLLGALHSLHLKSLDGLDLPGHVVCGWLERLEVSFDLVNNRRVVQGATVVLEIDRLGLRA